MTDASTPSENDWHIRLYPLTYQLWQEGCVNDEFVDNPDLRNGGMSPNENRDWILRICRAAETTPTQLARKANLAPSTINRFLKSGDNSKNLNATTMSAITVAGTEMISAISLSKREAGLHNSQLNAWDHTISFLKNMQIIIKIPVVGEIQADQSNFIDENEYQEENRSVIALPIKGEHRDHAICALKYFSKQGDGFLSHGDLLIAVPTWHEDISLENGRRVIVNEKFDNDYVVTTLRDIISDKSGNYWLMPVGGEADVLAPIRFGRAPLTPLSGGVMISFVVIGLYHHL